MSSAFSFLLLLTRLSFDRVFSTKLGSSMIDDLLFTENDLSCCIDIASTKDGKYITINSNSRSSSEEGHVSVLSYVI